MSAINDISYQCEATYSFDNDAFNAIGTLEILKIVGGQPQEPIQRTFNANYIYNCHSTTPATIKAELRKIEQAVQRCLSNGQPPNPEAENPTYTYFHSLPNIDVHEVIKAAQKNEVLRLLSPEEIAQQNRQWKEEGLYSDLYNAIYPPQSDGHGALDEEYRLRQEMSALVRAKARELIRTEVPPAKQSAVFSELEEILFPDIGGHGTIISKDYLTASNAHNRAKQLVLNSEFNRRKQLLPPL